MIPSVPAEALTLRSGAIIWIAVPLDPEDAFSSLNEPEDLSRYGL
ncbi:hypothetical protein PMW_118 [Pseudomonas phage phiPMW]|uniref:Uncharacterized protein n=1 Tax=Pseudomonas phage phiPMW TaxID=1815582 RepID=A0A1S5R1E9_9CAUD|nr:hypothetical protein FDG97_gp118 [Pseudomonas phage phiPMW]ANA49243.1 hypothetical protein PMW_118 [Pseudomonas phage phiPMW]